MDGCYPPEKVPSRRMYCSFSRSGRLRFEESGNNARYKRGNGQRLGNLEETWLQDRNRTLALLLCQHSNYGGVAPETREANLACCGKFGCPQGPFCRRPPTAVNSLNLQIPDEQQHFSNELLNNARILQLREENCLDDSIFDF